MRHTKAIRYLFPVLFAVLLSLSLAAPVAASVPQPTTLEIQDIDAYQNALESGDQLYLITYYIMVNSTQPIDDLFIFRLYDDTGLEIASTEAFPFHDLGYGLGLVAFYFEADDPVIPTWGSNLSVEIIGNPFIDWDGDVPGTTLDVIAWNTGTATETQQMISNKILYLATEFGQSWEVELVTTVQGITTLTSAGASYFMTVVPYLGEMVPYILGQYVFTPDFPIDAKPASDDYANWLEASLDGTVFDLGPLERAHHWSGNTIRTGVYYAFVIFLFVLLMMKGKLNKGTMLLFWPFVVAGAFFGVPLQVTIIAGFFCLISTVWVFYKGTT